MNKNPIRAKRKLSSPLALSPNHRLPLQSSLPLHQMLTSPEIAHNHHGHLTQYLCNWLAAMTLNRLRNKHLLSQEKILRFPEEPIELQYSLSSPLPLRLVSYLCRSKRCPTKLRFWLVNPNPLLPELPLGN